jgi:hypothetical protein
MLSNQFSFDEFVAANPDLPISGFDYLRAIYKAGDLPSDFLFWMTELICPTFIEVDGLAFVSTQFSQNEYQKLLLDGKTPREAQFWINLLEISGLFDELTIEDSVRLARSLCDSWNLKLQSKFPKANELARVIHDHTTNEVFVVVGRPELTK